LGQKSLLVEKIKKVNLV